MRRFEAGEKVAKICRDFGVSRTIFYRWLKRYEQERSSESLESLRPAGEEHYRFIPEAPELISKIVASDPRLSPQKISTTLNSEASKKLMSPSGVYYVLKRLNLNTYQKRLVFAQSNAPAMSHVPKIVREEKTPIGSIPSISALAPPGFLRGFFSSRPFIIFLSTFIPALLVYILISTLFSTQGLTARIGMIFSFTSLIFGIFFFIYSLKYYLTIALVLSFSRKGEEGPAGRQGEKKRGIGLQADLSNIHLERQPFVSIHIASFNEKRVINRLLTAATSLDYENYEVVIADDSTDETLDFLATWSKHPRVKISHRDTREGFKGGALRLALSVCDPRTEFVIVFDADFIPYPDTITQFLKYFQSTAGTLDFQQGDRVQGLGPRDNNTKPYTLVAKPFPIAAVQGYQWHVLNKSENWVTRGVRSEYSGSYVIERSGEEIYQGLKQISGSVYMIRRDVLESIGWGNSITEDFQLTLKLYEKGYKVVYTPYVQAPAEAVSTIKRLIRQRMRWAEGHSFNIRKMFTKLLFGRWEEQPTIDDRGSKIGLEGRSLMIDSLSSTLNTQPLPSTFNHPSSKVFVPSPLTLSEKLEFLYLTPYYLQAAFFITGTISWFIAEVIFQVRLPFWTEIWGWSLILTNMLALPLMNMVGLFLEEAEEKDYLGLFSFVALSYVVAPFQAYAAIKGFLEKEEGPWFRTPKTGRITDVFTPGRFYRFVWGVFGRGKPAVAPAPQAMNNPYLAFATANNSFQNFRIRPKKLRFVGRSVVVVLLILAMFLNLVSFGQNDIFSISGKEALLVEGKSNFQASERPEFTLKIPPKAPETKALSFFKRFLTPSVAAAAEPEIRARLFDHRGQEVGDVSGDIVKSEDDFKLAFNSDNLKPGKYSLKIQSGNSGETAYEATQDFTWGVLAVNTNKSIYTPGETVKLGFGTLDNEGKTLCNSKLELRIKNYELGIEELLSSEKGSIKPSGECSQNSVTNLADYLAEFQVQGIGTYKLHLTAITDAGERSIDDKFEVVESVPFDIERTSYPTRIYPPAEYPVMIKVTANRDFVGEIVETVPASFEITQSNNLTIQQFNNVTTQGDKKVITWDASWSKGSSHTIGYTIKFPRESPQFYLVGPLTLSTSEESKPTSEVFRESSVIPAKAGIQIPDQVGDDKNNLVFAEARSWQTAADVVATKFMETPDATNFTTLDTGKQFWSSSTGTVTYDTTQKKSGRGSWKSASGAGNASAYLQKTGIMPNGASQGGRVTAYFRLDSLIGTTTTILRVGSAGAWVGVEVTPAGVLRVWTDAQTVSGSTLSTGGSNWYRLTLAYILNASSQVTDAKLFLDGTQDISLTGDTEAINNDLNVGWTSAPGASEILNFHHVYVDDSTALTDTGDIRVTAKLANSETNTAFDTAIGNARSTTDYNNINERPISETNGWRDATANNPGAIENYGIQNAATGDVDISGNTLVARTAWVWAKKGTGTTTTGPSLYNNGTAVSITLTTTSTMFTDIVDSASYPSNSQAVGMQAINGGADTFFYEGGMMVASLGDPVPELALALAPLSFFAPKIIKSIQKGTLVEDFSNLIRRGLLVVKSLLLNLFMFRRKGLSCQKEDRRRRKQKWKH
ncbi:hypothetical protein A2799_04835 [Candidatus Roizmanbacteria bacterium RIFCSPHIGHO2_01_FULL_39_24]|uniref:Glycosyltransferase 2-like domain-containing protein n=1 Tax=Candidatus Roizmanbacteria bacterium RIFCSPHIGHO2_01_FULL_39_24 TaxID=1802032 RepID=A0A1F7GKK4_9BACT|nr:MAG: hypothetical protein A2799_04835 [Candidatus Roizmanbacteria bacterium RIFCSPHIGHO2_01_FULL_39_24]